MPIVWSRIPVLPDLVPRETAQAISSNLEGLRSRFSVSNTPSYRLQLVHQGHLSVTEFGESHTCKVFLRILRMDKRYTSLPQRSSMPHLSPRKFSSLGLPTTMQQECE